MLFCAACDRTNSSKQYHCRAHRSLAGCFYRFLDPFTEEELQRQEVSLAELLEATLSKKEAAADTRSRRKTLRKQLQRVRDRLGKLRAGEVTQVSEEDWAASPACAYCEKRGCDGSCWGVWAKPSGTSTVRGSSGQWEPRKHLLSGGGSGSGAESSACDGCSSYSVPAAGALDGTTTLDLPADAARPPALAVGQTVVRGPSWKWGRQDGGGEGATGVVESVGVELAGDEGHTPVTVSGAVRVRWHQTNVSNVYRYGATGCYDVVAVAANA